MELIEDLRRRCDAHGQWLRAHPEAVAFSEVWADQNLDGLPAAGRRRFVPASDVVEAFKGAPRLDFERFRAGVDQGVDQDPTPRG